MDGLKKMPLAEGTLTHEIKEINSEIKLAKLKITSVE